MAVASTVDLELRPLQMDAQKFFGCIGYFSQAATLVGDASGGTLALALREVDDKSKHTRLFLPVAITVIHDVNAAVSTGQLRILGKTDPQADQIEVQMETAVAIGGRAIARPTGGSELVELLKCHGWFYPIRAKQTTGSEVQLFEVRWVEDNPTAAETATLTLFGYWDYIKPWR